MLSAKPMEILTGVSLAPSQHDILPTHRPSSPNALPDNHIHIATHTGKEFRLEKPGMHLDTTFHPSSTNKLAVPDSSVSDHFYFLFLFLRATFQAHKAFQNPCPAARTRFIMVIEWGPLRRLDIIRLLQCSSLSISGDVIIYLSYILSLPFALGQ